MINVLLSTYNGSRTLPLMLESFLDLKVPEGGWKVFVVNNASTDSTADILKSYLDRLPLVLLSDPTPGKNHALNSAIPHLDGDLILFTDDDIVPDKNWLLELEKAASEHPEINVFAGQVRHHWMKKPPKWLEQLAADGMSYAGTPIDRIEGAIRPYEIKGANFMIRRELLNDHAFLVGVGPDGTANYVSGSETDFLSRLDAAGYQMHFLPRAKINHIVKPEQIGAKPVLKRYFRLGRGSYRRESSFSEASDQYVTTLFGYPRFMIRTLLSKSWKGLAQLLTGDSYMAMRTFVDTAFEAGKMYQQKQGRNNTVIRHREEVE